MSVLLFLHLQSRLGLNLRYTFLSGHFACHPSHIGIPIPGPVSRTVVLLIKLDYSFTKLSRMQE